MTNEEAINILESIVNSNFYGGDVQIACKMGIEALSRPSLPSNLDEAAEEYAWKKEEPLADGEKLSSAFSPRIDAFKAGAEWMAEQGETHKATVGSIVVDGVVIKVVSTPINNFDEEQEVIVQIRKAEEV